MWDIPKQRCYGRRLTEKANGPKGKSRKRSPNRTDRRQTRFSCSLRCTLIVSVSEQRGRRASLDDINLKDEDNFMAKTTGSGPYCAEDATFGDYWWCYVPTFGMHGITSTLRPLDARRRRLRSEATGEEDADGGVLRKKGMKTDTLTPTEECYGRKERRPTP